MAKSEIKTSIFFHKLLKPLFRVYLNFIFKLTIDNSQIKDLKGPYLVVANHTNFWDPFLLSMCIPGPVYFVTSDAYFRTPLLAKLLSLVGAIPKSKSFVDLATVKSIYGIVKNGGIIGIFPEGKRNWDGRTLPLVAGPAKLVKSLSLPVVSILFEGAYLSMPRWADKVRKGAVSLRCSVVVTQSEAKAMTSDEIYDKITQSLKYNEYDSQKVKMLPYPCPTAAEKLELFLFCCPSCNSIGTLESHNENFKCTSCGYGVRYDEFGFFSPDPVSQNLSTSETHFDNPGSWNSWQLEYVENLLKAFDKEDQVIENPLIKDLGIRSKTGSRTNKMTNYIAGDLFLLRRKISLVSPRGNSSDFEISDISGENVQGNNILEFYHKDILYRFFSADRPFSAYKWVQTIGIYKNFIA